MIYFFSIFGYLLLLGVIGVWKSKQVKTEEDFALAGRSLSPWIMVCTMLAVWIGTGSIVGNAEKTYETGMAALLLPWGTFIGMILLSLIARRARDIKASSVPEIIGGRFGQIARSLAVISLIIAYMVIVSYQFNAGGAVIEVITGDREPVSLKVDDVLSWNQIRKGRVRYTAEEGFKGTASVSFEPVRQDRATGEALSYSIEVVGSENIAEEKKKVAKIDNSVAIREGNYARIRLAPGAEIARSYKVKSLPEGGLLQLREPIVTAATATIIAAVFIVIYTTLAGLLSLAYMDIVTGIIITVSLLIAFPLYWFRAGGWDGMTASFAAMGDRPEHMRLWGVYSWTQIINYCLPVFLLVLGDANQYQRIFASRSAKGAKSAVTAMIFVALAIELLIIACAWIAASMTEDPEEGKYILIFAAKHYMPLPLGCLFMVTVVAIIISTADSFLLVPATTFMKDVYLNFINPKASEKKVIFLSRVLVIVFGIIAWIVSRLFAESTGFFEKALYAFTIYGASITPSLVAALVWPRATKAGSITSILAGVIVAIVWSEANFIQESLPAAISDLDAVLPAITLSVLLLIVVSLFTQNKTTQARTEESSEQ